MQLAQVATGRDNNYNLIRMLAAFAVLVSHSFALSTGRTDVEPLHLSLGIDIGNMAVDAFFITSGFLVTGSLLARQSALEFLWGRALRIYPALIVMVLLTVFGLGAALTTLPLADYLDHAQTHRYLWKCATLIWGVAHTLPGLFTTNPYNASVNGSLWTMPYEIRMYAFLLVGWGLLLSTRAHQSKLFRIAVVASCVVAGILMVREHFFLPTERKSLHLFFMFFTGAAFYLFRDRIRLQPATFAIALAMVICSAFLGRHLFFVVYNLTAAYLLFCLAYMPAGRLRGYNRLGDYSYGFYIYAFPVQQTVAALFPGISVLALTVSAGVVTLGCAILSWHLVERRALAAKSRCAAATRRMLHLPPAKILPSH